MKDAPRGFRAIIMGIGMLTSTLGCEPHQTPRVTETRPAPSRTPEPVVGVEGDASQNLLQAYIHRDPDVIRVRRVCPDGHAQCEPTQQLEIPITWEDESHTWSLPAQSKRIAAALVIAAAHDRLDSLRFILTPDAQWGWPDLRRPGARPVFAGDQGEAFFQALRTVAQRLPDTAQWVSQPVPPGVQMLLMGGAEPMWTFYVQGSDMILMRLVMYQGAARIDYVGLFEQLPSQPPIVAGYGPSPSLKTPLLPPPAPSGAR